MKEYDELVEVVATAIDLAMQKPLYTPDLAKAAIRAIQDWMPTVESGANAKAAMGLESIWYEELKTLGRNDENN